jgi:5-methylthioadenosine/S-adenosylhomocysteine deaminase
MRILLHNGFLISLDNDDRVLEQCDILIQDSQIVEVSKNLDIAEINPDRVIDASQKLVAPGLVNADLHADGVLMKGLFENRPLELRPDYLGSGGRLGMPASEMLQATAMLAGVEALKTGVTMVQDHWRFSNSSAVENADALFSAYQEIGLRANLALEIDGNGLMENLPYLAEILPPDLIPGGSPAETVVSEIKAAYERVIDRWHGTENGRLQIVLAPSGELWRDPGFISWVKETSKRLQAAFHLHLGQTKTQTLQGRRRFSGRSAVEQADRMGLLAPHTSVAHAIWITPEEIELLLKTGAAIIHTPLSDLYTGSGVVPLHLLMEAGVPIGLGTGESSGGNLNLFDVMKMTAALHRIDQPDYNRWPSVEQVLTMATRGGARACQLDDKVGQVAAGYQADLVLYDLKGFPFSPLNNPKDQLVCLENGSSVDTVMVGGTVVVESGRVTTVNEDDVRKEFRRIYPKMKEVIDSALGQQPQIEPYLDYIYRQGATSSLPVRRWADNPPLDSDLKKAFSRGE